MTIRPDITDIKTAADLRQWYWTKTELQAHAKALNLRSVGAKFTILDRIAHFLDTAEVDWPGDIRVAPKSKFDWHAAPLSADTPLTDNYRNTQNVRRFFKSQLGDSFKFNIAFMEWMTENTGKTLGDAVLAYQALKSQTATPGTQTQIKPHNQFNQYCRDFRADNPGASMDTMRKFWALKRAQPSADGRHVYHRDDLALG